jgi:hypothetical protein
MDVTRRPLENEVCRQGIPKPGGPPRVCGTVSISADPANDYLAT